jgi:divalent metal cation (Fe/Co/Zn/Cd) transporter
LTVALGFPLADPIIGLLITVAILAILRTAVRDVFRRLLDVVDPDLVDAAEAALAAEPGVTAVRSVKMRWIGHRIHADAELDVDPTISLTEAHRIAHEAEHTLTHAVPKLSSALIHAYPATTETYRVASLHECCMRSHLPCSDRAPGRIRTCGTGATG